MDPTPDGNTDFQVKYLRNKLSGSIADVSATASGNTLTMQINIAETGRLPFGEIAWMIETQSGTSGEPGAGFLDQVPDSGLLPHTLG